MSNDIGIPPKVRLTPDARESVVNETQRINDFQIAYYESVGDSNFLLMEELDSGVTTDVEYEAIKEHITLINDLIKRGVNKQEAIQELFHSIKKMAGELF